MRACPAGLMRLALSNSSYNSYPFGPASPGLRPRKAACFLSSCGVRWIFVPAGESLRQFPLCSRVVVTGSFDSGWGGNNVPRLDGSNAKIRQPCPMASRSCMLKRARQPGKRERQPAERRCGISSRHFPKNRTLSSAKALRVVIQTGSLAGARIKVTGTHLPRQSFERQRQAFRGC